MKTCLKPEPKTPNEIESIRLCLKDFEDLEAEYLCMSSIPISFNSECSSPVKKVKHAAFISTGNGTLVEVNETMAELLGYSKDDMIGMNVSELCVNPVDSDKLNEWLDQKGYVIDYRVNLRNESGIGIACNITSTVRWYNDEYIPDNQPLYKAWVIPAR
jgi:PAS domain-containing protein